MIKKIRSAVRAIREGRGDALFQLVRERWDWDVVSYGLRRDLSVPFAAPEARVPVSVRPIREEDIGALLDLRVPGMSSADREERVTRLQMLEAKIGTCYVAVTDEGVPCYMQWLFGPEEKSAVEAFLKGLFPMGPGEALLEAAYTPEAYRGKGIMARTMAEIAEYGLALGARYAITFVPQNNIPSLKGCKNAGFAPYLLRRERWRFFRRRLTFTALAEGTPYPFDR